MWTLLKLAALSAAKITAFGLLYIVFAAIVFL
jgi:hypothetical protein